MRPEGIIWDYECEIKRLKADIHRLEAERQAINAVNWDAVRKYNDKRAENCRLLDRLAETRHQCDIAVKEQGNREDVGFCIGIVSGVMLSLAVAALVVL